MNKTHYGQVEANGANNEKNCASSRRRIYDKAGLFMIVDIIAGLINGVALQKC